MNNLRISVNQLADFSVGTDAKKKRIIKQQKSPMTIIVARYQLAKARIKKTFQEKGDLTPVLLAIEELKDRRPDTIWKRNDKNVSIEALGRFIEIKLPEFLNELPYEVVKRPSIKSVIINGVEVIVSPDIIVRIKADGKVYLGAMKLHISKGNIFDAKQSRKISTILFKYLRDVVAKDGEEVRADLCMSLDVFSGRLITAPKNLAPTLGEIEVICDEVRLLWNVA